MKVFNKDKHLLCPNAVVILFPSPVPHLLSDKRGRKKSLRSKQHVERQTRGGLEGEGSGKTGGRWTVESSVNLWLLVMQLIESWQRRRMHMRTDVFLLYSRSSVEGGCDCGGMKTVIIIFKQVMFWWRHISLCGEISIAKQASGLNGLIKQRSENCACSGKYWSVCMCACVDQYSLSILDVSWRDESKLCVH